MEIDENLERESSNSWRWFRRISAQVLLLELNELRQEVRQLLVGRLFRVVVLFVVFGEPFSDDLELRE